MPRGREEEAFACHRCGACCTDLQEAWDEDPHPPQALPHDPRIHRLPQPGGLRVFAWEADRFPRERLSPLLVAADQRQDGLIGLAYELDADTCPNHHPQDGCTIYDERPLVCQAYPLLMVPGQQGTQLTLSRRCPGRVPVRGSEDEPPTEALAEAYPDEIGPALAVPAAVHVLTHALDLLETAGILKPVRQAGEDELGDRAEHGTVDLLDLTREDPVLDASTLRERVQRLKDQLAPRSS